MERLMEREREREWVRERMVMVVRTDIEGGRAVLDLCNLNA